jgi:hypothetical protein
MVLPIVRHSGSSSDRPAEFVLPDGTRAKWIAGKGDFGEFTFIHELPDIDWDPWPAWPTAKPAAPPSAATSSTSPPAPPGTAARVD